MSLDGFSSYIRVSIYVDIYLHGQLAPADLGVFMANSFVFSSESVGEGHPDKVSDYISDCILDACLKVDPKSRVACETMVKSNIVILAGEITIPKLQDKKTGRSRPLDDAFNVDQVVRDAIREIGYVNDDDVFHADTVFINNYLTAQSADIAQGVDAKKAQGKKTAEQGAGDQGIMFCYACNETKQLMPTPIIWAHLLGRELTKIRKSGKVPWLRPDAKTQVSVRYENDQPKEIVNVVISTQHAEGTSHAKIEKFLINMIKKVLPAKMLNKKTEYLINPTGKFVIGGPQGDSGLTGRKIIVDTYGGWGRHGGGAFSGKDPSKVDRSAAYLARYIAKNIVAAGIASKCEVQLSYAIGVAEPTSILVDTFGTGKIDDGKITKLVREHFDCKPAGLIATLDLLRPIYRETAAYGHFGREQFSWEKTDKADALKSGAGL